MLTFDEWWGHISKFSASEKDFYYALQDYLKYAARAGDPMDQKKREEQQDAWARARALEIAGDLGKGNEFADAYEDWLNAAGDGEPRPEIRHTREARERFDDWTSKLDGET